MSLLEVPGFCAAFEAVAEAGHRRPDLNPVEIITIAMAAARPHVQAELLADLADDVADIAPVFAEMLDRISHDIRKAIT